MGAPEDLIDRVFGYGETRLRCTRCSSPHCSAARYKTLSLISADQKFPTRDGSAISTLLCAFRTRETAILLRSQNATSSSSHGGRRYLPYAFTEHGAIMAASVLNSKRAIDMSIFVVRAFVQMRHALLVKRQIVSKLTELEARLDEHDADIQELIEAIHELMTPPPSRNRRIGFEAPNNSAKKQTKTIAGRMASGQ